MMIPLYLSLAAKVRPSSKVCKVWYGMIWTVNAALRSSVPVITRVKHRKKL